MFTKSKPVNKMGKITASVYLGCDIAYLGMCLTVLVFITPFNSISIYKADIVQIVDVTQAKVSKSWLEDQIALKHSLEMQLSYYTI